VAGAARKKTLAIRGKSANYEETVRSLRSAVFI